ncbi:MAG: hypothetical protein P1V51_17760 [Deltaproteobacteria bacterium]|nr:hypothetical protein [Deltaproteobacteria bacterium]
MRLPATLCLLTLTLTGCGEEPARQAIQRNGVWADDGGALLLMEGRYTTPDPAAPYFADGEASDWEVAFVESDASLAPGAELLVRPDPSQPGGGGLAGRVWWLRSRGLIVLEEYGIPTVISLAEGRELVPRLPGAEVPTLFAPEVESEEGLLLDLVPSPDGSRLALFHALAYTEPPATPGGIEQIHFVHVVSCFDLEDGARFLWASRLERWAGTQEPLKLDPPVPDTGDVPPEPPALPTLGSLQRSSQLLWAKDGSGFFVLDGPGEPGEVAEGAFVHLADGRMEDLLPDAPVPALALPTTGGPVRDDGLTLMVEESPEDPNGVHLVVHPATGWVPFDQVSEVALSAIDYAY